MRFIHCADIHLDSPLRGLDLYEGAPVEEMRQATRCAFAHVVDLAIDRSVDFVLIAGDIFDGGELYRELILTRSSQEIRNTLTQQLADDQRAVDDARQSAKGHLLTHLSLP